LAIGWNLPVPRAAAPAEPPAGILGRVMFVPAEGSARRLDGGAITPRADPASGRAWRAAMRRAAMFSRCLNATRWPTAARAAVAAVPREGFSLALL